MNFDGRDYRPRVETGDGSWRLQANCRGVDPALFYSDRGEQIDEARAVCRECSARWPCLEYALNNREVFGLWGGMSERQRRQLRRGRVA